ncbi:UNVERIFIED_CONTAM: hypothetical protein FKN15_013379 [Acipenser sinensis]
MKNLVLQGIQQFKRAIPERMRHNRAETITKEQTGEAVGLCPQGDKALAQEIQGTLQKEAGTWKGQICQKVLSAMNPMAPQSPGSQTAVSVGNNSPPARSGGPT